MRRKWLTVAALLTLPSTTLAEQWHAVIRTCPSTKDIAEMDCRRSMKDLVKRDIEVKYFWMNDKQPTIFETTDAGKPGKAVSGKDFLEAFDRETLRKYPIEGSATFTLAGYYHDSQKPLGCPYYIAVTLENRMKGTGGLKRVGRSVCGSVGEIFDFAFSDDQSRKTYFFEFSRDK
jgi:hypothetical protein